MPGKCEDRDHDEGPQAPQQIAGARLVRAARRSVTPRAGHESGDGQREQPGDLAAQLGVEDAQPPGIAAQVGA